MNKHYIFKLIALIFACIFHSAQGAIISIKLPGNTSTYSTSVGSEFDANIYIDSIADFAGFDFNLTFNTAKLSALTLTSGSIFGADTETFANAITPGIVHFAEAISATSLATAGLNINAATLLGTVHFKALDITGALNSPLAITNPILSAFNGDSLGGSIQTANVAITPAAVVPLPASAFLFAPGLLAFFGLRKNKKQ